MNTTYTENKKSVSISNGLAWLLALLSPIVTTIFTAIFRRDMDNIIVVIIVLSIVNFIIGYIDLKRVQKTGISKGKTALLTVALLLFVPLYLILRSTIINGFSPQRFIPAVVNIVLLVALVFLTPVITQPTIEDEIPSIQSSIVYKFEKDYGVNFDVVNPLTLVRTGDVTYSGMITLKEDSGYEYDLTIEVIFDGKAWRWTAS
ncbi:MAG: hypothetical protein LBM41_06240 [Ruminococcus sp.]|jgi:hypothetical protein|nr:hypothetical protein [Ruminococcus sp.]